MCEILQHFNAASPLAHSSSGTLQCAVFLFKYTHNPIAVQVLATGHDNTVSSTYHNFSLLPHQFTRRAGSGPFVVLQLADLSSMPAGLSLSLRNGDLPKNWCRMELSISSSREFCEEVGVRCKYYSLFLKISSPLLISSSLKLLYRYGGHARFDIETVIDIHQLNFASAADQSAAELQGQSPAGIVHLSSHTVSVRPTSSTSMHTPDAQDAAAVPSVALRSSFDAAFERRSFGDSWRLTRLYVAVRRQLQQRSDSGGPVADG